MRDTLVEGDSVWLDPGTTRRLLAAYGLPLVEERVCEDAEEAVVAAEEIGYPVVVKVAAAGAHKTELGGVALGLSDAEAVRAAAARMGGAVLVQRHVRDGVELLAGVAHDPVFGPLVAFGPGGTWAELIGGTGFRLAPLTDVDAEELVTTGKAGTLVAGFRGALPADAAALQDLVQRLSRLAVDVPALAELDLNPVLGLTSGAVVVDARVRLARPAPSVGAKGW